MQTTTGAEIGHTSVTSRLTDSITAVLYVPITKAMSDTEKEQVYKNLEKTIRGLDFGQLIGLDIDYSRYMRGRDVRSKFENTGLLVDASAQCKSLKEVLERAHMGSEPIYIIRDTSPVADKWSSGMLKCLSPDSSVSIWPVRSKPDLQTLLIELQSSQRGILINAAYSVFNYETNLNLTVNQIHDLYRILNTKHIDMAPFKAHSNLSFALITLDQDAPAGLYVNIARLDKLDASLIYKNLFRSVTGTITSRSKLNH